MYLMLFSYFYKVSTVKGDTDWDSLYSLNCALVITSSSNINKYIKDSYKKNPVIGKKHAFPLCLYKFKDKEEINEFTGFFEILSTSILNLPIDNKRFTRCGDFNKYAIKVRRLIKVSSALNEDGGIQIELNRLTIYINSLLTSYLDKKLDDKDLFKSVRVCDKYVLNYIKPDRENPGLYLLKDD